MSRSARASSAPGTATGARQRVEQAASVELPPAASRDVGEGASACAPADRGNGTHEADLRGARTAFESRFIAEQRRANGGNVSRTAEALGISRVMLQKKMKEYGLR